MCRLGGRRVIPSVTGAGATRPLSPLREPSARAVTWQPTLRRGLTDSQNWERGRGVRGDVAKELPGLRYGPGPPPRRKGLARTLVTALALLATLLRLSAAAVMPLALPASVVPTVDEDGYARFVATFGADAFVCAAMSGSAGEHAPARDGSGPGHVPDCAVCPFCISVRDLATAVALVPPPVLPLPSLVAASAPPIPTDHVESRDAYPPVRARAPPRI